MQLINFLYFSEGLEQFHSDPPLQIKFPNEYDSNISILFESNEVNIDIVKNKNHIPDFYSNKISNISAICGKNGSGKTQTAYQLFSSFTQLDQHSHFISCFEDVCSDDVNIYLNLNIGIRDKTFSKLNITLEGEHLGVINLSKGVFLYGNYVFKFSLLQPFEFSVEHSCKFITMKRKDKNQQQDKVFDSLMALSYYNPSFTYGYKRTYPKDTNESQIPNFISVDNSINCFFYKEVSKKSSINHVLNKMYSSMFLSIHEILNNKHFDLGDLMCPMYVTINHESTFLNKLNLFLQEIYLEKIESADRRRVAKSLIDNIGENFNIIPIKILLNIFDSLNIADQIEVFSIDNVKKKLPYLECGTINIQGTNPEDTLHVHLLEEIKKKKFIVNYLERIIKSKEIKYQELVEMLLAEIRDNFNYWEFKSELRTNTQRDIDIINHVTKLMKNDEYLNLGFSYAFYGASTGHEQMWKTLTTLYKCITEINQESNRKKMKLKNILVILDEGDLGFHPEWKQSYVKRIIKTTEVILNNIPNQELKIHFLICTNDPIILSDILSSQVNYLELNEYKIQNKKLERSETFSKNIYDLYKDDFFLKHNGKGEFSVEYIKRIYSDLIDIRSAIFNPQTENRDFYKELILLEKKCSIVGDRFIQNNLNLLIKELLLILSHRSY